MSLQTLFGGLKLLKQTKTHVPFTNTNISSVLLRTRSYTSLNASKFALLFPNSRNSNFGSTQTLFRFNNIRNYVMRRSIERRVYNQEEEELIEEEEPIEAEIESDNVSQEEYVPARFDDITSISPKTQKALREEFRYATMSKVQDAVLSQSPIECDLFVKAKTGTGKTLAFLIPAIDTMLRLNPKNDGKTVQIMILSPTRELAQQIAAEAERLTRFYDFRVHCLVGGEKRDIQIRKLMQHRADIVVGTPGRVEDLLQSLPHFKRQCREVKTLILDEADQLLDMGFRDAIERIIAYYPRDRQTFLFSATVSPQIRQISKFALKPDYTFIDTVDPNDVNTNTHIKQSYSIVPYDSQPHVIRKVMNEHRKAHKNGKIIMFLPTRTGTILYSSYLRSLGDMEVFELHSGKNQDVRTRVSNKFRNVKSDAILVTSDVSARGVDYPGVTLVLQVGAPSSREQYIHRLGRTGRAGKEGEGILLLAPFEKGFMRNIEDLPLQPVEGITEDQDKIMDRRVEDAIQRLDMFEVRTACMSALGYYTGKLSTHFIRKDDLIDSIMDLGRSFGTEVRISPAALSRIGINPGGRGGGRPGGGGKFGDRAPSRFGDRKSFGRFDDNSRPPRNSFDRNNRFSQRESRDRYKY
ncbi:hypothetical protein Glove_167g88 [Diversispora epigaea]|uniref:ATP-dependent RNA helicase n=1 Tax=Diversispora epigaea TaxID=1348612 RepID=A0A397IQ77_9GLOM|nr:hypothetical protein Glove_167g88 [Diversispora epigaea]